MLIFLQLQTYNYFNTVNLQTIWQLIYIMSNFTDGETPPSPMQSVLKEKKQKRGITNRKKKGGPDYEQVIPLPTKINKSKAPQFQIRIDKYFKKVNPPSGNESTNSNSMQLYLTNPSSHRLNELEQDLKKKEEVIEHLRKENSQKQSTSCKIYNDFANLKTTTKYKILELKKQLAALTIKQKSTINLKYGYFRDQTCRSNFVQGVYLSQIQTEKQRLLQILKQLESQKCTDKTQTGTNILSKIQYYQKSLKELNSQLQIRKREVNAYKERLKLAYNQKISLFAQQQWPLLKNRYQPLQLIGSGGFGEVYKGYDIQKDQKIAIKVNIVTSKMSHECMQNLMKHLKREITIHKQLQHPNIVRMIDQLQLQSNNIGFILQYCSGPDLRSYLNKQFCLDEREAKIIVKQLIYAIKYLHDQKYKIIHYDLKPANIMFHEGIIKIVDFGISKIIDTEQTNMALTSREVGTFWYLPPEVFDENSPKISSKVDIWSIGVIFYQMLYNIKPFGNGLSQSKILYDRVICRASKVQFPPESPKNYIISEQAKQFITECLKYNPEDRLSPQEAYEHEYLN